MVVDPSSAALAVGVTKPFSGSGGTAPYTYAVLAGGAGGTIDSDGIYTAPAMVDDDPKKGYDTIQVTDSLAATAIAQVLVCTPIQLICDILRREMGLSSDRVYLWDQKINEPTDKGIFIAVGVLLSKPFGNTSIQEESGGDVIQSVNVCDTLTIDIISQGPAARNRKEEILMALQSVYAQQQMELNSFGIARLQSNFVNLSQLDGTAIPYRFSISINIQYFVKKTKSVPYFDDFDQPEVIIDPEDPEED